MKQGRIAAALTLALLLAATPSAWGAEAVDAPASEGGALAAGAVGDAESLDAAEGAQEDAPGSAPSGQDAAASEAPAQGDLRDLAEPQPAAAAESQPAAAAEASQPAAPAAPEFQLQEALPGSDLGLSGYYELRSAVDGAFAVDVSAGSVANGANIQLWSANGMLPQLFKFVYDDGWYYIVNMQSGLALDLLYGSSAPGTNVQQYRLMEGNPNQQWAATRHDDGTVTFVNRAGGLALDVSAGRAAAGTNIQGWTPNGLAPQNFSLVPRVNLLAEGLYTIVPSYTSRPLDVAGSSTADGGNVALWQANGAFAQKWAVRRVGENTYTIQSTCSGLYLAATEAGDNVVQRAGTGGYARWRPDVLRGAYVLQNVATGTVLDVSRGIDANGANVSLYKRIDSDPQRFYFRTTVPLANGTYQIKVRSTPGIVVDLVDASRADGANIQFWKNLDNGAQKWVFTRNADGTYVITNAATKKALDLQRGQAKAGTNIRQWPVNGAAAQNWRITFDSGWRIASAVDPSFVLDVSGGVAKPGVNLQLWSSNDSAAQRFTLAKTTYVPPIPASQQAMIDRAQGMSSDTKWLILVDTNDPHVGIFYGSKGNWDMRYWWVASCGKASTPTVKGYYTIKERGLSFGHGYTCWYWTQFYGDYLFHSLIYESGSMTNLLEGANTLGVNRSLGCVRVEISNAKWIHDNIPRGTQVFIW